MLGPTVGNGSRRVVAMVAPALAGAGAIIGINPDSNN